MAFNELCGGRGWLVRGLERNILTGKPDAEANMPRDTKANAKFRGMAETGNWDEVHVVPVDDIEHHQFDLQCDCGIEVEYHGCPLVIHQAWDGREGLEWAETILSEPPDAVQ